MSFSGDISKFARLAKESQDKIARTAALDLFAGTIRSTPVDTGRARGNWQTTVGEPSNTESRREDPSGSQAIADVMQKTPQGAGQEVFLTNNLPYIEDLEYGSSTQAPQGMMRINFARVQRIVAAAIARFRV